MGPRFKRLCRHLIQLALPCFIAARGASAQQQATLRGFVTDKSTGQPVAAAQITFVEAGRTATTDTKGHFEATGLPAGSAHLAVRAAGFAPLRMAVNLMSSATIERSIELDSTAAARLAEAQKLPEVEINAPSNPANYRLADFERRRLQGRGQYLTETEIVKSGAYNVNDLVKNMRGVLYECGGGAGCHVYMARAPMRCRPEFIVDGQVMNDFGPVTPIRDIIALEVYSGPTEVPGEYAGRYAGCGVVVIWTRSGPTRKPQ